MNFNFKRFLNKFIFADCLINNDGYPSVSLALQDILGNKTFSRLLLSTPDRRQIMQEAAAIKGIAEDEMIKKVAEKLELPVFFKPKAIDLKLLPESVKVKDLRRTGLCPVIDNNLVCGVICVDPAELSNLADLYSGSNIYLSSWDAVLGAIDESEQIYLQSIASKNENSDQHLIAKMLNRLLNEMDYRSADSMTFVDAEKIKYTFLDAEGQQWEGEISPVVGRKLLDYLQFRIASQNTDLSFFGFGSLSVEAKDGQIFIRKVRSSNIVVFPGSRQSEIATANFDSDLQILLVDDNQSFLEIISHYLKRQGFSVVCRNSVKAAKEYLTETSQNMPGLIISDLHLRDGSGLSLLQEIKVSKQDRNLPFIILSSDSNPDNEIKVLTLGADAFIAKNKDPKILTLQIKRLLGYRAAA